MTGVGEQDCGGKDIDERRGTQAGSHAKTPGRRGKRKRREAAPEPAKRIHKADCDGSTFRTHYIVQGRPYIRIVDSFAEVQRALWQR